MLRRAFLTSLFGAAVVPPTEGKAKRLSRLEWEELCWNKKIEFYDMVRDRILAGLDSNPEGVGVFNSDWFRANCKARDRALDDLWDASV
jgi:hypothetical protein